MNLIFVAAGLIFLLVGGELLVRGSVALAERFGISKLIIGLTIVAMGTSAPELVVTLEAVLSGVPGLALGNVVGSNIANILLVLGVAAVIVPIACDNRAVLRDGLTMIGATVLFVALAFGGSYGRIQGLILVAGFIGFLWVSYVNARRMGDRAVVAATEEIEQAMPQSYWLAALFVAAGLGVLMAGSHFLISGSVAIARNLGVSDEVIGITLVAVGTSLPELATAAVASVRRHGDIAIGNAIGSNIFNVLGVLGVTAIVAPIPVGDRIFGFDLWILLATSVLLLPFVMRGQAIGRGAGVIFLLAYGAYVTAQFHGMSGVAMAPLRPFLGLG